LFFTDNQKLSSLNHPELLTVTTNFHTHAYTKVLEFDTKPLSPQNRSIAKILQHRSRIALGQARQVISDLSALRDVGSRAVVALAHQTLGNEMGVEQARGLAENEAEDATVQVVCGTVLAAAEEYETAVELLGKHQGSLEAYVFFKSQARTTFH
jgi:coatomer subunit epsilon